MRGALHPVTLVALVALVALCGACRPEIGDPCRRAIDCSARGDRQCDLSNTSRDPRGQGECILEGCSRDSCPKEAVCVKVYSSKFLSVACDPQREDIEVGVDDCDPNEICLPEGLCADEITARTSCRRECKRESECRSGYDCVEIGSNGVYLAADLDHPTRLETAQICAPEAG
jgi:hypothetical protein